MCGRFALYADENEIVSHFHLSMGFSMRQRFNIAPTQIIPVVTQFRGPLEFFRWGLIPSWEKSFSDKMPAGYANARIESVVEKPAFKRAFARQRCLIPASGYYEWRQGVRGKQPYFLYLKNELLLGLAGIWSVWQTPQGEVHSTCAILTQEAPDYLKPFHPRAPIIIQKNCYREWLSSGVLTLEQSSSMFLSAQAENIGMHAVTHRMGHPQFDGPECVLAL